MATNARPGTMLVTAALLVIYFHSAVLNGHGHSLEAINCGSPGGVALELARLTPSARATGSRGTGR